MSVESFHSALIESASARAERRRSENHASGRVLMAGVMDRVAGRHQNSTFADHSDVRRCGCGERDSGFSQALAVAQPDPGGEAGSGTNFQNTHEGAQP